MGNVRSSMRRPRTRSAEPSTVDLKRSAAQAPAPLAAKPQERERDGVHQERKLGDSELSYYLPSRADGVNDMYLHLGFSAPARCMARPRVALVWALLRLRHPLLASSIAMHDYDDVRFVYAAPSSAEAVLRAAEASLEFRTQSKHELIDGYLNGPRTLSNDRLSCLIISEPGAAGASLLTPPPSPVLGAPAQEAVESFEYMFCAAHFIGDGMALHRSANEFFALVAGEKTEDELMQMLSDEWKERYGSAGSMPEAIPACLEQRLPLSPPGKLRAVADRVDFEQDQAKQIGGHTFPRRASKSRRTVVPTIAFDAERTRAMLKTCKAHGVSISAALFAICNIAWARTGGRPNREMCMMMYSALNLRPYFVPVQSALDSYWFFACGYFNVMLPAFLPSSAGAASVEAAFWHRARAAKEQSTRAAKTPRVAPRVREMARVRGERARRWGREDDEKAAGTWVAPAPAPVTPPATPPAPVTPPATPPAPVTPPATPPTSFAAPAAPKAKPPPSSVLLGLSLLGNLDGVYAHKTYPAVTLRVLTTGSRQRSGGMLLFGYTFAGRLWLSLGYDEEGFDRDVVDNFWGQVLVAVGEFLMV